VLSPLSRRHGWMSGAAKLLKMGSDSLVALRQISSFGSERAGIGCFTEFHEGVSRRREIVDRLCPGKLVAIVDVNDYSRENPSGLSDAFNIGTHKCQSSADIK